MATYFNEVSPATTSIEVKNIPVVAGKVKASMLAYKYAEQCEYYSALKNATSVKDIFDIFNIKFELKDNRFYPVIKDIEVRAGYKTLLENIAPYMNDGNLIAKDDYHVYTIKFSGGKITGTRRSIGDNTPTTAPQVQTTAPANKAPKKPLKSSNKGNKNTAKKYGKIEVRTNTDIATIQANVDNRYTIEEITKEFIRQILNGNGGKYVEVKGDVLFKSITKTA